VDLGILTVGHQTYVMWSQICISQVSQKPVRNCIRWSRL